MYMVKSGSNNTGAFDFFGTNDFYVDLVSHDLDLLSLPGGLHHGGRAYFVLGIEAINLGNLPKLLPTQAENARFDDFLRRKRQETLQQIKREQEMDRRKNNINTNAIIVPAKDGDEDGVAIGGEGLKDPQNNNDAPLPPENNANSNLNNAAARARATTSSARPTANRTVERLRTLPLKESLPKGLRDMEKKAIASTQQYLLINHRQMLKDSPSVAAASLTGEISHSLTNFDFRRDANKNGRKSETEGEKTLERDRDRGDLKNLESLKERRSSSENLKERRKQELELKMRLEEQEFVLLREYLFGEAGSARFEYNKRVLFDWFHEEVGVLDSEEYVRHVFFGATQRKIASQGRSGVNKGLNKVGRFSVSKTGTVGYSYLGVKSSESVRVFQAAGAASPSSVVPMPSSSPPAPQAQRIIQEGAHTAANATSHCLPVYCYSLCLVTIVINILITNIFANVLVSTINFETLNTLRTFLCNIFSVGSALVVWVTSLRLRNREVFRPRNVIVACNYDKV